MLLVTGVSPLTRTAEYKFLSFLQGRNKYRNVLGTWQKERALAAWVVSFRVQCCVKRQTSRLSNGGVQHYCRTEFMFLQILCLIWTEKHGIQRVKRDQTSTASAKKSVNSNTATVVLKDWLNWHYTVTESILRKTHTQRVTLNWLYWNKYLHDVMISSY